MCRRHTAPGTRAVADGSIRTSLEVDEVQPDLGGERGNEVRLA